MWYCSLSLTEWWSGSRWRDWRWKKGRRGIKGAYWPQGKRIIKVDWLDRSGHPVLYSALDFLFFLYFPPSLHLPFHLPVSLVHSQCPSISSCVLRVSSGGPICHLRGIIVGSTTEDDGGKRELLPQTVPLGQMGSEDCSAFLPLKYQPSCHLWPVATKKHSIFEA